MQKCHGKSTRGSTDVHEELERYESIPYMHISVTDVHHMEINIAINVMFNSFPFITNNN